MGMTKRTIMVTAWLTGLTSALGVGVLHTNTAHATTYEVGPGKAYADLFPLQTILGPGDVVLVEGDAVYPGGLDFEGSGTASNPVLIKGVRKNGKRPTISGGQKTVNLYANHVVFEGFEVTGGSASCIVHQGDDITIRDTHVHDCPAHGILGTDYGSGSLLMEYVEVSECGQGDYKHSVYIATDEIAHPGSVFRMQHCFVHDANGGHSVKSRAERNEIYYNWIEGATYHELDLVGPEEYETHVAREDSDIVGNVLRQTKQAGSIGRLGGDGTGETWGRYRFVHNTMIIDYETRYVIRLQDGVDSLELHNNVVVGGGPETDLWADYLGVAAIGGTQNWVDAQIGIPSNIIGATTGTDPGFASLGGLDYRPSSTSPLLDLASAAPGLAGHPFPSAEATAVFEPAMHAISDAGQAPPRPVVGAADIGAFEFGVGEPSPPGETSGAGGAGGGASGRGGQGGAGAEPGDGGGGEAGGEGGAGGSPDGGAGRGDGDPDDPGNGTCQASTALGVGGSANGTGLLVFGIALGLCPRARRRAWPFAIRWGRRPR
jgi:hypothetical protein